MEKGKIGFFEEGYTPKGWTRGEPLIGSPAVGRGLEFTAGQIQQVEYSGGTHRVFFTPAENPEAVKWLKWWYGLEEDAVKQELYDAIDDLFADAKA